MLTLNDGRSELWQWDTGRTLAVDADCSQVHFSNKVFGRSIDVDVADGTAIIPDVLLQTDKDLNVWAFVGTAENGYTKISKTFKVNRRNKPADYVFTPVEQTTIAEIAAIAQSVRDDADAGVFDGAQGPAGADGKDGAPGADGHTPEYGVDYGTQEQITEIAQQAAGILQPDISQIKDDLSAEQNAREQSDASLQQEISNKLPKSPTYWEPWTAAEQTSARKRMGIHGDYELIDTITIAEDSVLDFTFPYPCKNVLIIGSISKFAAKQSYGTFRINRNVNFPAPFEGIPTTFATNTVWSVEIMTNGSYITIINTRSDNMYLCGAQKSTKYLSGISISSLLSTAEFLAGTELIVYGVRA